MTVSAPTVLLIECRNGMNERLTSALSSAFPKCHCIAVSCDESFDQQLRLITFDAVLIAAAAWNDEMMQICRAIRTHAKHASVPVLFHSAESAGEHDQLKALESGVTMMLEGDATAPLLIARLSAVLQLLPGSEESRMESELRESRERYDLAMDATSDGLYDWNLETNEIYYSPGWKRMLGYDDDELPNDFSVWERLTEEDDVKKSWALLQKLTAKEVDRFELEFRMRHKNGQWVDILSRAKAVFNAQGRAVRVVGTHLDITERKRALRKLRESEQRFQLLFTNMRQGFALHEVVLDEDGAVADIRYVSVNPVFETIIGMQASDVIGKTVREIFPETESYWIQTLAEVAMHGHTAHFEDFGNRFGRNFEVWMYSPLPRQVAIIFSDRTMRRAAEKKLQESEERYRMLFDNLRQGFALHEIILDDAGEPVDYRFLSVNPAFEKLTGLSASDIIGKTVREVLPATEKEWIRKYGEVALGGKDLHFTDFAGELGRFYEVWAFSPRRMQFAALFNDSTERYQYETMLRESEKRFREMMVLAPVAYQSLDPNGRILDVNNSLSELLGYSREDLIGRYFGDLYSEETRDQFPARFQKFISGQVSSGDLVLNHASGKTLDVYFKGRLQKDVNGQFVRTHCVLTDITERKNAERALSKSEALYHALFEEHPNPKFILDTENGSIVDANHAATAFYGWSRDEFIQKRIHDINTLDDDAIDALIQDVITGTSERIEYQHRRKDGSLRDVEILAGPIEIDGKILLHTVILDITKRKQAEQQLRLLEKALRSVPVSVLITNAEGTIAYVNPQVSHLTGYSDDEMLGKNPRMFQSGHHTAEFYEDMWTTILSGKDWIGEMRNRKKNNDLYWERAIISPLLGEDGSVTHLIGLKMDITEQKRIMDELVVAKEQAEESDRLKSAFLANMSHEVRTPMNAIMGFSDLLHDGDLSDETRREYTSMIWQRTRDLLSIMDDILNIALLDAGQARIHKAPCDVIDMMDDIYSLFHHLLEQEKSPLRLEYENDLPTEKFVVETDEGRVRQVMSNLLSNAIKFTHEGHISFGCRINDTGDLQFFVKDTGIGIPAKARESVFDRFRQVATSIPRPYGGNGLGLSISKGFVELLGGEIWFESELGSGTTFYFTLPRFGDPAGAEE